MYLLEVIISYSATVQDVCSVTVSCVTESLICCKAENKPIAKYCINCGLPFGIETALKDEEEQTKYDELMSKLMENEKVGDVIKELLKNS